MKTEKIAQPTDVEPPRRSDKYKADILPNIGKGVGIGGGLAAMLALAHHIRMEKERDKLLKGDNKDVVEIMVPARAKYAQSELVSGPGWRAASLLALPAGGILGYQGLRKLYRAYVKKTLQDDEAAAKKRYISELMPKTASTTTLPPPKELQTHSDRSMYDDTLSSLPILAALVGAPTAWVTKKIVDRAFHERKMLPEDDTPKKPRFLVKTIDPKEENEKVADDQLALQQAVRAAVGVHIVRMRGGQLPPEIEKLAQEKDGAPLVSFLNDNPEAMVDFVNAAVENNEGLELGDLGVKLPMIGDIDLKTLQPLLNTGFGKLLLRLFSGVIGRGISNKVDPNTLNALIKDYGNHTPEERKKLMGHVARGEKAQVAAMSPSTRENIVGAAKEKSPMLGTVLDFANDLYNKSQGQSQQEAPDAPPASEPPMAGAEPEAPPVASEPVQDAGPEAPPASEPPMADAGADAEPDAPPVASEPVQDAEPESTLPSLSPFDPNVDMEATDYSPEQRQEIMEYLQNMQQVPQPAQPSRAERLAQGDVSGINQPMDFETPIDPTLVQQQLDEMRSLPAEQQSDYANAVGMSVPELGMLMELERQHPGQFSPEELIQFGTDAYNAEDDSFADQYDSLAVQGGAAADPVDYMGWQPPEGWSPEQELEAYYAANPDARQQPESPVKQPAPQPGQVAQPTPRPTPQPEQAPAAAQSTEPVQSVNESDSAQMSAPGSGVPKPGELQSHQGTNTGASTPTNEIAGNALPFSEKLKSIQAGDKLASISVMKALAIDNVADTLLESANAETPESTNDLPEFTDEELAQIASMLQQSQTQNANAA